MLWGYIDESGEHHKKSGQLKRLTLAGCIAPLKNWQDFDSEWGALLARVGIADVHMHELSSRKIGFKSPYRKWTANARKVFLNSLLRLMNKHIPTFVGLKIAANPADTAVGETYRLGVGASIIQACTVATGYYSDNLSLVFASHPELKEARLGEYCDQMRVALPSLKSVSMMPASAVSPLQAADIFSYELSHCKNWHDLRGLSQPLKALRGGDASFFVNANFPSG